VKIALNANPWAVIAKLRGRCPGVELVAKEDGDVTLLRRRHEEFSGEALGDSWFRLSRMLQKHIDVVAVTNRIITKDSKDSTRIAKDSHRIAKDSQDSQFVDGNFIVRIASKDSTRIARIAKDSQKGGGTEAEAEAYKEVPSAVPHKGGQLQADPNFVTDYGEAKRLICERILNGKNPNRLWSADADKDLLKHLPIPRLEIERVAWFRGMANDGSPELEARKPITETGLMAYWGDEVTRANAFWQKLYGWREKRKLEQQLEKKSEVGSQKEN
jgi:hypothetical protein